jgi:hypothetical protein
MYNGVVLWSRLKITGFIGHYDLRETDHPGRLDIHLLDISYHISSMVSTYTRWAHEISIINSYLLSTFIIKIQHKWEVFLSYSPWVNILYVKTNACVYVVKNCTTYIYFLKEKKDKKYIYWTAHTSNTYIQEVTKTEINT